MARSEQAAYCVRYAMLDCWACGDASASRHGFREGLRASTLHAALRIAGTEDAMPDWDGLSAGDDEPDPLLRRGSPSGNRSIMGLSGKIC